MLLIINTGSSSLKSKIYKEKSLKEIAEITIEKIGEKKSIVTIHNDSKEKNTISKAKIENHNKAITTLMQLLLNEKIISDYSKIKAIGHRVVHGGEKYSKPTKITPKVIKEIEKLSKLAPLHNPVNLQGIYALQEILPNIPHIAIFDTAFHQTMKEKAFRYAIPHKFYKKHNIRRYGFHGISHQYIVEKTQKLLRKKRSKIVTCHLGNGASITASVDGKSIDTTMGLTPLEGIIMGTRSGSIDPSIPLYLQESLGYSTKEVTTILNNESGLKAISRISNDMRDIYAKSLRKFSFKNKSANLAINMLAYQIAKQIGAYAAAMNGIDAITFTATLGENAFYVREKALENLKFLGLNVNKKANSENAEIISDKKSSIKVFILKTDEELQIANNMRKFLTKS